MRLGELLTKTTEFFKNKNIESARLDTELLICHQMKWDRIKIYMNLDYPMSEKEMAPLRELVKRRATGEPVAYITGEKYFYKDRFEVGAGVLVPRPETELIVEEVKSILSGEILSENHWILDLGCGSGCIGLSVLADFPALQLTGLDISPVAIEYSTRNAELLQRQTRSQFRLKDLKESPTLTQDLGRDLSDLKVVVSNPPYIAHGDSEVQKSVHEFEPHVALYSTGNGLDLAKNWLEKLGRELSSGTWVIFEMGKGQDQELKSIAENNGFQFTKFIKDYSGVLRHIVLKK